VAVKISLDFAFHVVAFHIFIVLNEDQFLASQSAMR